MCLVFDVGAFQAFSHKELPAFPCTCPLPHGFRCPIGSLGCSLSRHRRTFRRHGSGTTRLTAWTGCQRVPVGVARCSSRDRRVAEAGRECDPNEAVGALPARSEREASAWLPEPACRAVRGLKFCSSVFVYIKKILIKIVGHFLWISRLSPVTARILQR